MKILLGGQSILNSNKIIHNNPDKTFNFKKKQKQKLKYENNLILSRAK